MPKLELPVLLQRIQRRIEELESGKSVAARDIQILLSTEQYKRYAAQWQQQLELRKAKPARTSLQKSEYGYKTKQQVALAAFKQAYAELEQQLESYYVSRTSELEVRRAKLFLKSYFEAKDESKNGFIAANNALVRAHLQPFREVTKAGLSKRDREIQQLEDSIRNKQD